MKNLKFNLKRPETSPEPPVPDIIPDVIPDVSDITVMIVDNGPFVSMARTIGRAVKQAYYTVPGWVSSEPTKTRALIGAGYEEIEIVPSMFSIPVDEIDCYIFLDVGWSPEQLYLESIGKKVWGARQGELLELMRIDTKKFLKEVGLPVGPYEVVKGTEELREYLKKHDDQIVKVDLFRFDCETFKSLNYDISEYQVDEKDHLLGVLKKSTEFLVEECLRDKVEVGMDGYSIDGKFPSKTLFGIEIKDLGYCAKFTDYENLPECVREVNEKLSPRLAEDRYRQFLSTEIRVGKDKKPYLIDVTSRCPSPPNELYQVFYKNLPEAMWRGTHGEMVDPDPIAEWGAEIILQTEWTKLCQPIIVPKEFEKFVFLKNAVQDEKGQQFVLPQRGEELAQFGAAVGYGGTLKAAMEMAKEVAENIEGLYVEVPDGSLDKAQEQIEKSQEMGVWVEDNS